MVVFTWLILLTHEDQGLFPCSSVFLSFFLQKCKFSWLKSSAKLTVFMPRDFLDYCEEQCVCDLFLSNFCYCFKNAINFYKLVLQPVTFLTDFILSKFLVQLLRFLTYIRLYCLQIGTMLLFFFCLMGLVRDSNTILKQSCESKKSHVY